MSPRGKETPRPKIQKPNTKNFSRELQAPNGSTQFDFGNKYKLNTAGPRSGLCSPGHLMGRFVRARVDPKCPQLAIVWLDRLQLAGSS